MSHDFDSHLRRTAFWLRIKIFVAIMVYEAAIALVWNIRLSAGVTPPRTIY
jgi:hypothetical protein